MAADPALIASLSPQQVACLRLVGELRTSKQIADILGISSHTVDTHLSNAVRRLGAANRMEAARLLAEATAKVPVPAPAPPPASAGAPPQRLTGQFPPVAATPTPALHDAGQHDGVEPAGRQVTLSRWLRLAIIAGGAVALVYAVVLVVVGAEVIMRMTERYSHSRSAGVAAPHGGTSRGI
jgi:DNA-binding CsgD family transcriptional regulator